MRNKYIENFEKAQTAEKNLPDFRAGDTVRLAVTIKEGDKTRVQSYEGVCIAKEVKVQVKLLLYVKLVLTVLVLKEFSQFSLTQLMR